MEEIQQPLPKLASISFWISAILCLVICFGRFIALSAGADITDSERRWIAGALMFGVVGLLSIRKGKIATILLLLGGFGRLFRLFKLGISLIIQESSFNETWTNGVADFVLAIVFLFTGVMGLKFWKRLKLI
jgi:hypothetical protein